MQEAIVKKLESVLKELNLFSEKMKSIEIASIPKMGMKEKAQIGLFQIKLYALEGVYISLYELLKASDYQLFTEEEEKKYEDLKLSTFNLVSSSTGNIVFSEEINKVING